MVWLAWAFPNDEAQIAAVLERIADGVSGGADEGSVARHRARASSLRDEFAPDVHRRRRAAVSADEGRDAIYRRCGSHAR